MSFLREFWNNRYGGNAIEYGLLMGLIVIGLIFFLGDIGGTTQSMYENLDTKWKEAKGE